MILSKNSYDSLKQFGNEFTDGEWQDLEFQTRRHIPMLSLDKHTLFMLTELGMDPNDAVVLQE